MKLTKQEREEIHFCISMRMNYIQTGDISLSQTDAVDMGKPELIKPLTLEQMRFLTYLSDLRDKILNGE